MDRVTARGFASMIVSQAAWMAGFQVVFGTLDKFKEALNAVFETETAVTRAFRTQRSELWSLKEIWDQLKKSAEAARMATGRPIEEIGEIGRIEISGVSREKINEAIAKINEITFVPVVGEVYKGKVVKVMDFGAFVAIAKGTEGLLHISEIEWSRLDKVPYNEGDEVEVKFMGYDDRKKMKLSRKVLLPRPPRPEKKEGEQRGPRPEGQNNRSERPNRPEGQRRPEGEKPAGDQNPSSEA
jgi:polyribonucleotide nucleotidyltransferase